MENKKLKGVFQLSHESSGGFAWISVIIVVVAVSVLGSGVLFYQYRAEKQESVDELREEIQELKQTLEKNVESEVAADAQPSVTELSEPAEVIAKPRTQITQEEVVTKTTQVQQEVTESQLSKQEACEAEVLAAKVDEKKLKQDLKDELYKHVSIVSLEQREDELVDQLNEADNMTDIEIISSTLEDLRDTVSASKLLVNMEVEKIFAGKYEKMLSDCLNEQ